MSDNEKVSKNTKVTKSEGNTNPRFTKVCLTLNNYTDDDFTNLIEECTKMKYKFIIGKEVGANGTKHLQGYIEFGKQISLKGLKELNDKAHWEKARGNRDQNFTYCSKDGEYETNLSAPVIKPVRKLNTLSELRDWQKECLKRLDEQNDRQVLWVWEKKGGFGKSAFAKYLAITRNALIVGGKGHDIRCGVAKFIEKYEGFDTHTFVLDFTRTIENYISYQAIEEVKNGAFFSGKYESCMVLFNNPKVIIFANFKPDMSALSEDRWDIMKLE